MAYPSEGVTVDLSREYEQHGIKFKTVRLRAPKMKDLLAIGEPFEWQTVNGSRIMIQHEDRIDAYLQRLASAPTTYEALADLELPDALKVKEAFTGFFSEAWKSLSPKATPSSSVKGEA